MFSTFKKPVKRTYLVQQYHSPRLPRTFYVESDGEAVTPRTSMKSQANYWRLLLEDGYHLKYEDGSKELFFIKGDNTVHQLIVGASDE
tara:strand:+ start:841 stop:1104 length:264 start_codon:yes stop_codon:yes gene_type:complete